MPTRSIGSTLIQPGADRQSTVFTPGQRFRQAVITLVDTDGHWDTRTGNVLIWGIKWDPDGNGVFDWGPVFQGHLTNTALWIPFGSRSRGGEMPSLSVERDDLGSELSGVRLAIRVDANIRLGAEIVVN